MRSRLMLSLLLLATSLGVRAQAPRILKIDPPNWYATFPKPLLLVRGEALTGATFTLSDAKLGIERTVISENGHWAQLWLSASPATPETIHLRVAHGAHYAEAPYTFAARRAAGDGMAGFSPRDIMYLILTDRFADGDLANDGPDAHNAATSPEAAAERAKPRGWHGGDLRGIAQHLDYLQSLGVTTVWPTPVYQNHGPEAYHGYHATDYYAVDEHYGSLSDLQALAAALHARGMKLVLDTVPNHVGPFHPWVTDEPAPDWFHGTRTQHVPAEYNFAALINPHAPERDRLATLHGWFVDLLPDNDTDSPAVSTYLRQNVIWWIEQTGADGLRYDTLPYVNRQFWHDLNFTLHSLYPHLNEVGEISDGDPEITSAFAGDSTRAGIDTGLGTPFDFPFHYALRNVFATAAPMSELAHTLARDDLYPHPERLVPFLDNHDQTRFMSEPGATLIAERLALAVLLTTRGTPQLYTGDELAMAGGEDPDNRRDFPGGFPGAPQNAFDPAARTPAQLAVVIWVEDLAKLRQAYPALSCGAEQIIFADQDTLVYARTGTDSCTPAPAGASPAPVIVAVHRGAEAPIHIDLSHTAVTGCNARSIGPSPSSPTITNDVLDLRLGTDVAILACQ